MARFLVSYRVAGAGRAKLQASLESHEKLRSSVRSFADVVSERPQSERTRGLMVVNADPREMQARKAAEPSHTIIEPEVPRQRARFTAGASSGPVPSSMGTGASFALAVQSARGPVAGANVNIVFANLQSGASGSAAAPTDSRGRASIPYNPAQWWPTAAVVTPRSACWTWWGYNPANGSVVTVADLPGGAALGWWHQLLGVTSYTPNRGQGIRVGLADSGAGPHPYLAHVESAGAFLSGSHDNSPGAANDVGEHGTHVCGLIGARPPASAPGYAGIAPGAAIVMARVFPDAASTAGNGDIASAIDALSTEHSCDLINLSMGGAEASEIELDAITAATQSGALVVAAAGNGGAALDYPAAYPGVVAVSALGLYGAFPANAIEALAVPSGATGPSGSVFEAAFNNTGPHMACTAPGVGVISTVPGASPADAAYAVMSGTSMACPAVCGALATLLSADAGYRKLPRNAGRAAYAWGVLVRSMRTLGLSNTVQGYGLPTASAT